MTSLLPLPLRFHEEFMSISPNNKKPSKTSRFQGLDLVAGTRTDQNLQSSQVEVVAGGRNRLNLRPQKGPVGGPCLRELVSKFEIIARASNRLNLLFQAPA
jgi:hypothetical protein